MKDIGVSENYVRILANIVNILCYYMSTSPQHKSIKWYFCQICKSNKNILLLFSTGLTSHIYIYIYIYNWKKSANRHLAIMISYDTLSTPKDL